MLHKFVEFRKDIEKEERRCFLREEKEEGAQEVRVRIAFVNEAEVPSYQVSSTCESFEGGGSLSCSSRRRSSKLYTGKFL